MKFALTVVIACLVTLLFIHIAKPIAFKIGLVDRPNDRKQHRYETALIGGLAIFFGFCFSLLTLNTSLAPYRGLLAGASLLVLMGAVDDFSNISSNIRLIGQFLAAALLVLWSHSSILEAGNLFFSGDLHLGWFSIPASVLIIMVNINAMNMMDGQDGLAAGIGLVQAVLLAFIAFHFHASSDMKLLLILAAILIVFLYFNTSLPWRDHATIFLGDAGSTFIAFLLSWFAIRFSQINPDTLKPFTILWIMSLPIFDLINVVIYRIRKKQSIFKASRDHIHHILHIAGLKTFTSSFILVSVSAVLGIIGIVLNWLYLREAWQLIIWLICLIIYLLIVSLSRKKTS